MTSAPVRADRLTEIARAAYETGAYTDCRFIMAATTQAILVSAFPPPPSRPWTPPPGILRTFHEIPILLDNATEHGVWRLLNRAGDEVERGRIEDAP